MRSPSPPGGPKSFYVRTALRENLEDLEDSYTADLAIRKWEESGRESRLLAQVITGLNITDEEWAQAGRDLEESGEW